MIDMPPDFPPLPKKPVAEALADCGLVQSSFKVTYEEDLQGNVVAISVRSGAKKENLQCIWDGAWTELVQFEDKELQASYDEISRSRFEPFARQQARDALSKRGLLDGLPQRNNFPSLAEFAVAIERHCGFAPHQILRVSDETIIADPGHKSASLDYDKAGCLFSALAASDQTKFGFVGNENLNGR